MSNINSFECDTHNFVIGYNSFTAILTSGVYQG